MSSKNYYKYLDILRLISCIAVLFYHFNLLKGGYLAVCTFFVLTGYLSCISFFRKEKISLLDYYKNRFKKIYLPLLIVVLITVGIVTQFKDIVWLNLKFETTSILLGYNNFWQLSANLDYFARHISSPFMHFWYIGILLQFELIFPFIFLLLKKIGDKTKKYIPCILTTLLSIVATIYFYYMSITNNVMVTYYDTFSRIFSILFGVSLGFIHSYYGKLISKKMNTGIQKLIFYIYLIILILLFIFISADSKYFALSMIITTLISCRLIDYGTNIISEKINIIDKITKSLASISYEIYLIQYPIIFIFQHIDLKITIEIPLMILITLLLSYLSHFILDFKNAKKKILLYILISILTVYGGYKFITAKDYTKEIEQLEAQLAENEKLFQQKQEQFEKNYNQNKQDWLSTLEELENIENDLLDIVKNMNIVGIGDSVMLGALKNLYVEFPNGYFDAKTSRTAWVVKGIINDLKSKKILGDPIVLNLGANGDCPDYVKKEFLNILKDKKIFWINVANNQNKYVNNKLLELENKYENLHVIDWNSISKEHPEYFLADKIHLTDVGRKAYAKTVFDEIYKVYLEEYKTKKEELIQEYEDKEKNKIVFYGNNILINSFKYLENDFSDAKFTVNAKYSFESIKNDLINDINNNKISNNIVIALDYNVILTTKEYEELINICGDRNIYILSTTKESNNHLKNINKSNVTIIDFYTEIINHNDYLMNDKLHLTDKGNIALVNSLKTHLISN